MEFFFRGMYFLMISVFSLTVSVEGDFGVTVFVLKALRWEKEGDMIEREGATYTKSHMVPFNKLIDIVQFSSLLLFHWNYPFHQLSIFVL